MFLSSKTRLEIAIEEANQFDGRWEVPEYVDEPDEGFESEIESESDLSGT